MVGWVRGQPSQDVQEHVVMVKLHEQEHVLIQNLHMVVKIVRDTWKKLEHVGSENVQVSVIN